MALLTDGNPNDTEALRVYETAILDLAHVETIDLDAKLGLATEEISQEVLDILLGHTPLSYAPAYDYQGSVRRRQASNCPRYLRRTWCIRTCRRD